MKRIIIIIATVFFPLVSCDKFLTADEATFQSKEFQFRDFENCKKVATNVYGYLKSYQMDTEETMREAATDNAVFVWEQNNIKRYYDGSWSGTVLIDDVWSHYYSGIRAANYFLENCPDAFPGAEFDDNYYKHLEELRGYKNEVKVLRALFHFELLKRYRKIVIVEKSLTLGEVNSLKPSSYGDVTDWISRQIDEVQDSLPLTYKKTLSEEFGRVTRGIAAAVKCRALLYAASPLNNGDHSADSLWLKAAATAKEIIDMPGSPYKLRPESVYNDEASYDLMLAIREYPSNQYEINNFPMGAEGATGGVCPSQNLVEAFDLLDGTPFNWEEHKDIALDASLRDPRLARTVYMNGDIFKEDTLQTYYGGRHGIPMSGATPTSYYLRKFIREETSLVPGFITNYQHIVPLYRYAEVYLNYAEALFEATGKPNFHGVRDGVKYDMSPIEALNKVRARAKVGELDSSIEPDEFRERLRNERRVEFAFEDHRFWDIRRWGIAPQTMDIYGLELKADDKGNVVSVERKLIARRYWDDRYYFYPISDSECMKNPNLPSWDPITIN